MYENKIKLLLVFFFVTRMKKRKKEKETRVLCSDTFLYSSAASTRPLRQYDKQSSTRLQINHSHNSVRTHKTTR